MDINKLRAATPPDPNPIKPDNFTRPPARTAPRMPADDALAWCLTHYKAHHGPLPAAGGRNAWLTALTFFCNEKGVLLADLDAHALGYAAPDFTEREIRQTVGGIYTREAATHGSKPYTAPLSYGGNKADFAADFRQKGNGPPPPTLPAAVYDALPDFLRRCCEPFDGHERAVMLLSTLGVLSGCFPTLGGLYDGRRLGLNLFVLVIGPAAAGKSALRCALSLVEPYDERLQAASRAALADYEADKAARQATRKGKGANPADAGAALVPPPFKMLLLPGNQSAAALYESLADNDGRGIIAETELDTLSEALKQDWGGFSDVLRKAFHHERLSLKRKGSPPLLLPAPALSLVLSGTPGQVPRLVPDAENGLFSRFWFYLITDESDWRDMGPGSNRPDLAAYFAPLADEVTRMMQAAGRADVELAPEDWARFNRAGKAGLADARSTAGGAGASTAFRLGPIVFRTVALLTVLRYFDNGEIPAGTLVADPADVTMALALADVARAHALAVLAMLPTAAGTTGRYAAKAGQEARAQELHAQGLSVREIAQQVGVHYSTVSRWLNSS